MKKMTILAEMFLEHMDSCGKAGIAYGYIYKHLFQCKDLESLEDSLQHTLHMWQDKSNYPEGGWWYEFTKFLRQGDYFTRTYREYDASELTTDELKVEYVELYKWYRTLFKQFDTGNNYREIIQKIREIDANKLARYDKLTRMRHNKERDSLGGHLDMILYHLVDVDQRFLYTEMITIFGRYLETKKKKKVK